jgi:hypothetical protein
MAPSDIEAIARLDHEATGWTRREMLNRLIEVGDGYVLLRDGIPAATPFPVSSAVGMSSVLWSPKARPMRAR